ncbi:hypothetical protein EIN_163070 [Entamoeba invadens IP1]|uniref:Leucine rich repeat containing protein BspA family protein n=1 Tax=Entamoeba invadens IP1 TaxID=370355 RepID=L7FK21_ENTIV|nr:hypothetical protein EIN_163070 [Entamoeba invadens IP1]ELP85876.1 hypothetical protein EIN_163070 [Entamoeba invadens IP1]|eukprot:XP_004185222.1 hypothetical protein EIN_163070 [Entamoeba invadens IP1]
MAQLDSFHGMVVSQYFSSLYDFIVFENVSKKFRGNTSKFHYNPLPLTTRTLKYFENVETLHLYKESEENFGNDFFDLNKENGDKKDCENFYQVVIHFKVSFQIYLTNSNKNFVFKNVTFTKKDRENYGNVIPSGVTFLGENCFEEVDLSTLEIPNTVKTIGEKCFCNMKNLIIVTLSTKLLSIGKSAFEGCEKLRTIKIPDTITSLHNFTFNCCCSLAEIKLSQNLEVLGELSFGNCTSLCSIELPNKIKELQKSCFIFCTSLKKIILPTQLSKIGKHCFEECNQLKTIEIPSKVERLAHFSFERCSSLMTVTVTDKLRKSDSFRELPLATRH